eukprot:m.1257183 g.1257183  ORF g.1257183 m.1257183 type:complete len:135 (+) comp24713_c0_seq2:4807-5211(+)
MVSTLRDSPFTYSALGTCDTGAQPKSSAALLARIRARSDAPSAPAPTDSAMPAEDRKGFELAKQVQAFMLNRGGQATSDAVLLKFGPMVTKGEQKLLFREILKELCDGSKARDARGTTMGVWTLKEQYRSNRLH